ncbi:MAG: GNAT family N-acetyltransferase [Lachnospiraceae bacterium]|jgi:predicted acetyltransferase|nr:GNAT family N-acetyltransferase [Lachnospiraceae bacterium]
MIIRKIKGNEIKRTSELFALAFEFGSDEERSAEEIYQQIIEQPQSREDRHWQERWAAFEDDDATMMGFFIAKPMPINFDGQDATMTGIGGVATLPQYRRRGCIRACFVKALPDMYEKGIAFSYLYPFSTAYYRKFGYETAVERIGYEVLLDAISADRVSGSCYLCEPGGPVSMKVAQADIQAIYRDWQSRYNLMVDNDDSEFDWVAESNPVKEQVFTYVYRDASGSPRAFATFTSQGEPGVRDLICSRFFFRDWEGFRGLLQLAKSYASDHRALIFKLPTDQTAALWIQEWSMGALKREIISAGMVRVINVVQVLKMARYRGSGRLVIDITDQYIPQNNGRFVVNFADGRATDVSSDVSTDVSTDVSVGIGDFSRLITGTFQTDMLPFMPTVQIHGDREAVLKVFYPKPCYITEPF